MTICPKCKQTYPDDFALCPRDGSALLRSTVWTEGSIIRDKYRVGEEIGAGGMATVYRAEHIRFREEVALKVINAELAFDKVLVARFSQEAIMTRKLTHANIVRVLDLETAEDGRPFIVMELVRGKLLKDELKGGPLPVERALLIAKQVAEGLQAAHDIGLVHRDIKPGNIMLQATADGEQAKILDFGIARVKESLLENTSKGQATLTGTGMVVGTPTYMSPEQAMGKRGEDIDGRADLYALSAVTYQMLTGQPPLPGNSALQLILSHIEVQPTPIEQLLPELPKHVAATLMRCLAKNPDQRPKSCREFVAALDEGVVTEAGTQTPAPVRSAVPRKGGWLSGLVALGLVILVCAGIAAVVFRQREVAKAADQQKMPLPPPVSDIVPASKTTLPGLGKSNLGKSNLAKTDHAKRDEEQIPVRTDAKQVRPTPATSLFSPSALKFAPQKTGTKSSPRTVIVSNTSDKTMAISHLRANREFVVNSSACGSLAAGATCSVSVVFSPEDAGPRSGTLQFVDTATGSSYSASLTGIGVANISGSLYFIPQTLEVWSDSEATEKTKRKSSAMCSGYSEQAMTQVLREADVNSLKVVLAHGITLCPDSRLPENVGAVWNSTWGVFLWNPDHAKSVSAVANILYERARKGEFPDHSEVFGLDEKRLESAVVPGFKPRETSHPE